MANEMEEKLAIGKGATLFKELKDNEEKIVEIVKKLGDWLEFVSLEGDPVTKEENLEFLASLRLLFRTIQDYLRDEDE